MGSSGPVLRRKLTAILAVIALGCVALYAPVFTSGVGDGGVRLRTVGLPQVGLVAKDPGRKVIGGFTAAVLAGIGGVAPVWVSGGVLPGIAMGERDCAVDAPTARGPPAIVSLS